ncbi:hypothetical protein Patl1_22040 [Pistacia atlantica]|uniref:Uncharacterized protein n=1 Tax=Pistacia atlantica TaxID=434234 RepID=A0ACC1BI10_9ROSI|nr:hypothetical protein Patl1_22040 [Pistacia atlantica]
MNDSSFKSSLDLNPRRDNDDDDQRKSKVDDSKIKLPAPSFKRLFTLNLLEWKQASLGCLSAVLSGAVQPVYSFIIGSTMKHLVVLFAPDQQKMQMWGDL